ncbi:hypothetical protein PHLCEN_2v10896 [Hermanssonia centrifuga]|uniref:Uncharacterized protein n=1 Tax=Hermanssonia centrifuga TaxID=98765 RepID=A0A2R6NLK3_9APHY|nr:hypothetical protein PHLCEN_2v10896 [Hermanssonia centrifuga]
MSFGFDWNNQLFRFTDKQVLAPDFKDELGRLVKILRPFVHCINDLMTVQNADSSDEDDADDQDEEILDIPSES